MHHYKDQALAVKSVNRIRRFYPDENLYLISDGDEPLIDELASVKATFIAGERLKLLEYGGAYIKRYLQVGWNDGAELICVLDPDTAIFRRFNFKGMEKAEWFGTVLYKRTQPWFCLGGLSFFRRETIKKILDSGLLDDPKYTSGEPFYYKRYSDFRLRWEQRDEEKVLCRDEVMADLMDRLSIKPSNFPDVLITFRSRVDNTFRQYSAIHPYYD